MGTRYQDNITVEANYPQVNGMIAGIDFTNVDVGALGEPLEPQSFIWRNRTYRVTKIVGHWREDSHHWNGRGITIPQADFYRLMATPPDAPPILCEITFIENEWHMQRIWD